MPDENYEAWTLQHIADQADALNEIQTELAAAAVRAPSFEVRIRARNMELVLRVAIMLAKVAPGQPYAGSDPGPYIASKLRNALLEYGITVKYH